MGKRLGKKKESFIAVDEQAILAPGFLVEVSAITAEDIRQSSSRLLNLLSLATEIFGKPIIKARDIVIYYNNSPTLQKNDKAAKAFSKLKLSYRVYQDAREQAGGIEPFHWKKRYIIHNLGLTMPSYSALELLKKDRSCRPFRINMVKRERITETPKLRMHLSDSDHREYLVTNCQTGFYEVETDESVIFYSGDEKCPAEINIEMAVIRGVACQSLSSETETASFYRWLQDVVGQACSERRDVRPDHNGAMAQIGLNMGPRHARVLGWAKSFTKKLDGDTATSHDLEAIGAVSIAWSLFQAVMPSEIIIHVNRKLEDFGLPRLATRNIDEGAGFAVEINQKKFLFPEAERAPPEAYFSRGYEAWSHIDQAYCTYAFTFCVGRDIKTTAKPPSTRAAFHCNKAPDAPGASFVDCSLRVVVKQAPATAIAFKPDYPHGTTVSNGATNFNISITFSERVGAAWLKAKGEISVAAGNGAGEGNTASNSNTG